MALVEDIRPLIEDNEERRLACADREVRSISSLYHQSKQVQKIISHLEEL